MRSSFSPTNTARRPENWNEVSSLSSQFVNNRRSANQIGGLSARLCPNESVSSNIVSSEKSPPNECPNSTEFS